MDDYAKARMKDTRKLIVLKMMTEQGTMNSMMSAVDFVYDGDLNKSLEHFVSFFFLVYAFRNHILSKRNVYFASPAFCSAWRCWKTTKTPSWMRSCATRYPKTFSTWCAPKRPTIVTWRRTKLPATIRKNCSQTQVHDGCDFIQ